MNNVDEVFDRYQSVRHRLPALSTKISTIEIGSLLDIASQADAFVFDAFGVLNIGDRPIDGAAARLDQLRADGRAIRILSNAASYDHPKAVEKFQRLGIGVSSDEIVTSRDAALLHLETRYWGCIAAPGDALPDIPAPCLRLGDDPADYHRVEGFLFLSTDGWTAARQAVLEESLLSNPRTVVIANPDIIAPRETGFSLEPGQFGHLLADQRLSEVRIYGKPFPDVYEMIEGSLPGVEQNRIVMCGDTLHTDILGAAARGWRTVLITRDGLFSGTDTKPFCHRAEIYPDWRSARI